MTMELLRGIHNIIFDLGGVLLNIDYAKTRQAFLDLGFHNFDEHYTQFSQTGIFDRFDKGEISPEAFFSELAGIVGNGAGILQLEHAWNAMLLDFPRENLVLLENLKTEYRIFLFSNTNEPHLEYFFQLMQKKYGLETPDILFERVYYSCRIGMRKPDPAAFRFILGEDGLKASETLFIDDSPQHVQGAESVGIRAYYLKKGEKITNLLN